MRSLLISAAVVSATLAGLPSAASADTITLDASVRSWLRPTGQVNAHNRPDGNYIVGLTDGVNARNFFVFDLSGITDVIVSASLVLETIYNGTSASPHGAETYTLFDVTSVNDVINGAGSAAYDDLGTGTVYGASVVTIPHVPYSTLTVALNQDAIAAIQASLGSRFGIGGAITSIEGTADQFMFAATNGRNQATQLVLDTAPAATPVPEPATLTLLGAGLAALATQTRRRKI